MKDKTRRVMLVAVLEWQIRGLAQPLRAGSAAGLSLSCELAASDALTGCVGDRLSSLYVCGKMASCTMEETPSSLSRLSSTADCTRRMYPAVDEYITPLPRHWSTKDKSSILGLSHNNLVVHYKGLL